jgi:opacity protein-like surface antigen
MSTTTPEGAAMKKNFIIITILVSLLTPALCTAYQSRPGGYMSAFIGATIPDKTTVTTDVYAPTFNSFTDKVEFDPGLNVGMTGGYDSGFLRMEGELSYKYSEIDKITDQADNYSFQNVDGNLGVLAVMFNSFIDLHNDTPVTPYFGGGIGFATLYLSDTYGTDTRGLTTTRALLYLDDLDSVFAYQVGGGLDIAMSPVLSLDLSYRYFGTSKADFDSNWDVNTGLEFESHNVAIGFRIKF